MKAHAFLQGIPEAPAVVVPEEKSVAHILGSTVFFQPQLHDLVVVTAGVPVGCRGPEEVAHLIYLTAGLIERGPEDVAGRRIPQHGKPFGKGRIGNTAPGGVSDSPQYIHMGAVISHPVADDGDLHVRMDIHKLLGYLFQQFHPLLQGVEA